MLKERHKAKKSFHRFINEDYLPKLSLKERLAILTPEERLADLEQHLADLSPEQRLASLNDDQILETLRHRRDPTRRSPRSTKQRRRRASRSSRSKR
jgi:hypothetical protein